MKKTEKDLWDMIDRTIFKTDDPQKALEKVKKSGAAWLEARSTFGGSLRQIRRGRKLTTADCAARVGVPKSQWQSWEANRQSPTAKELDQLCAGMKFGERKKKRFLELLADSPRQRLLIFSRFRPESLAARGAAKMATDVEIQKLPEDLQKELLNWCKNQDFSSVEDLVQYLLGLEDDQARENWVNEVLAQGD